jgi:hypothetical protein
MRDLAKVARKFTAKKGDANAREVSELCLEIIQAWGEAFLPRSKSFPNFAKTYHELRKEGLPFRPQYDESRVPVFTPPPSIPDDDLGYSLDGGGGAFFESPSTLMDAELAAALALSMSESSGGAPAQNTRRPSAPSSSGHTHTQSATRSTRTPFHQTPPSSRAPPREEAVHMPSVTQSPVADVVAGCQSSMMILKEVILAARSSQELRSDDIAEEVAAQLRIQQSSLGTAIERELGAGTGQVCCSLSPPLFSHLSLSLGRISRRCSS